MLVDLSPFMLGIVVILVLSASMSTLSSLVLASSSTLTLDFIRPCVEARGKEMSVKSQVSLMRGACRGVRHNLRGHSHSAVQPSSVTFIAQLMGVSWGALAGAFLAPFLYGLYWKRATAPAVWASFIFGVGFMTANMFFGSHFPAFISSPINAGRVRDARGACYSAGGELPHRPPKREHVDECFSCYSEKVTVSVKSSLADGK